MTHNPCLFALWIYRSIFSCTFLHFDLVSLNKLIWNIKNEIHVFYLSDKLWSQEDELNLLEYKNIIIRNQLKSVYYHLLKITVFIFQSPATLDGSTVTLKMLLRCYPRRKISFPSQESSNTRLTLLRKCMCKICQLLCSYWPWQHQASGNNSCISNSNILVGVHPWKDKNSGLKVKL